MQIIYTIYNFISQTETKHTNAMFTFPAYTGRNSLPLSSCPLDESGVQVQSDGSTYKQLREEAQRFKEMLEAKFPEHKKFDCRFKVTKHHHDFGTYFDVEIEYEEADFDETYNDSTEFALFVESNLPQTWSETGVLLFAPEQWEPTTELKQTA